MPLRDRGDSIVPAKRIIEAIHDYYDTCVAVLIAGASDTWNKTLPSICGVVPECTCVIYSC